jgi:hypothetical protein
MDQNLIQAGQANFNLPHDVVPLPSGGIFYKSKKKSVKVGYLTAADENILISAAVNSQSITMSLLESKVYEPDLRPRDMLDSDVEAIMIFLRNSSFGPEYTVTLKDPKTDKPFEVTVVLEEFNIRKPENPADENGFFVTKLPKSGIQVKLKPLTYAEKFEIDKMVESYPQGMVAPRTNWYLGKVIVEVNGDSDLMAISNFIQTLPIMDSKYIRTFLKENVPSLDLRKVAKAPSGENVPFEITFGESFFRPFF